MSDVELTNTIPRGTPPNFVLDASILDEQEMYETVREDVKQNRIEYVFPDGLNQVDLYEEARALTMLDDFETMYDFTMSTLHGRPVIINILNYDGTKRQLCAFQVVDRYMNLRGVTAIDTYPCLVTWLTEFMGAYLLKKYPTPKEVSDVPIADESGATQKKRKKRAK